MRDEERMWRIKEMKKTHEERMGERLRRRKEVVVCWLVA